MIMVSRKHLMILSNTKGYSVEPQMFSFLSMTLNYVLHAITKQRQIINTQGGLNFKTFLELMICQKVRFFYKCEY